jgi:hypothetical protein
MLANVGGGRRGREGRKKFAMDVVIFGWCGFAEW